MDYRWLAVLLMLTLLALAGMICWAPAQEADTCKGVGVVRGNVERAGGEWIEMTHDQAVALRVVFKLDPNTPDRFPYGDGAAVAKKGDLEVAYFIDGDMACDPQPIHDELLKMLQSDEFAHPPHAPGRL